MKTIFTFLLASSLAAFAELHAVLNAGLSEIERFEDISAELVQQYRNGPNPSKVARYRLVVIPERPAVTLQQESKPAGTGISDGGFILSETTVTRVWVVHKFTAQEISERNAAAAGALADELENRLRRNQWESGQSRNIALLSEYTGLVTDLIFENTRLLALITKAVGQSTLTNNLTAPERAEVANLRAQLVLPSDGFTAAQKTRAQFLQGELIKAYQLWKFAQTNRIAMLASPTVQQLPTWPDLEVGE